MGGYYDYKRDFLRRHDNDFRVETSSMNEYGEYQKEYICADGAIMYEVNRPEWIDIEISGERYGIEIKKTESVKVFRTEVWNSDNPNSEIFRERW